MKALRSISRMNSLEPVEIDGTVDIVEHLTGGAFSHVYKAKMSYNKTSVDPDVGTETEETLVAVKEIPIVRSTAFGLLGISRSSTGNRHAIHKVLKKTALREAKILEANQENKFIVKYFGHVVRKHDVWIVTELCKTNMSQLINGDQPMDRDVVPGVVFHMIVPIVKALGALHRKKFIHRDVKDLNILVTDKGIPKLCDFGFCKSFKEEPIELKQQDKCGTSYYIPPEMIKQEPFDRKIDSWSLGITILSLMRVYQRPLELKPLFYRRSWADVQQFYKHISFSDKTKLEDDQRQVHNWFGLDNKHFHNAPQDDWERIRTLLKALLALDPSERKSVQEASDDMIEDLYQMWDSGFASCQSNSRLSFAKAKMFYQRNKALVMERLKEIKPSLAYE